MDAVVSKISIAALSGCRKGSRARGSHRIEKLRLWSLWAQLTLAVWIFLGSPLVASANTSSGDRSNSASWQVAIGPVVTFKAETAFTGFGGFAISSAPPLSTGGPTFGVYDDGFVLADISGDTTLTSNWGYTPKAEYDKTGGGSIRLSSATGIGTAGVKENDEAAPGLEIRFSRSLPALSKERLRWSLEVAFGYSNFETKNSATLAADLNRVTDAFSLDGVIPPLAPYTGSFTGPGPLLGTTPMRSTSAVPNAATISGQRKLDADLLTLRFGPRVDTNLTKSLALYLSGGVAVAYADGSYRFNSTVNYDGGKETRSGRTSDSDFLSGFFVEAGATWTFADSWALFGSVQHRALEDFSLSAEGTRAELSFEDAFSLSGGLRYSF